MMSPPSSKRALVVQATSLSSKHVFGEGRCLLSLDLDFADVVRFPPRKTAGIAVLRLPKGASLRLLEKFVTDLLSMLHVEHIAGRLWIVEAGRIPVHENNKRIDPDEAQ